MSKRDAWKKATCVLFAFILLATNICPSAFTQDPGIVVESVLVSRLFDNVIAPVSLRNMKVPGGTVGMGPKRLTFDGVAVNMPALNLLSITNGTNSRIEIDSVSLRASCFYLPPSLSLPLTIPAQTEALLTVGFLPTHPGNYRGAVEVLYRTSRGGSPHKLGIALKGKGVLK